MPAITQSTSSRRPTPRRPGRESAGGHSRRLTWGLVSLAAVQLIFLAGVRAAETAPPPPQQPKRLPLSGQLSTRFAIDDANPEGSIPTNAERDRNPLEFGYLLQDLLERAEQARKAKDFPGVIRYYRAVAKAVPDNAKGWSKLCEAYEIVHDRDKALRACRYAIDREAADAGDYLRYVHLILAQDGELSAGAKAELGQILTHLDKQEGTQVLAQHLRCETGVKLKDVAMLETCTQALAKVGPDDPKTVVFQWSLALLRGHRDEARDLLIRARAAGVVAENVARMEEVTFASSRASSRGKGVMLVGAILVLAAAAALIVAVRRRRGLGGPPASA